MLSASLPDKPIPGPTPDQPLDLACGIRTAGRLLFAGRRQDGR